MSNNSSLCYNTWAGSGSPVIIYVTRTGSSFAQRQPVIRLSIVPMSRILAPILRLILINLYRIFLTKYGDNLTFTVFYAG